ncbi:hypothetical protein E2C01_057628 [Portunus trituberculatus]|uniref:Uncharacterized protein n=1 Tax=Portunus trituberculatus TaxID=210409 RepID=A0A5B7GU17_PORTR|nr:hypothetical protein [Portunus trituberculatus]
MDGLDRIVPRILQWPERRSDGVNCPSLRRDEKKQLNGRRRWQTVQSQVMIGEKGMDNPASCYQSACVDRGVEAGHT